MHEVYCSLTECGLTGRTLWQVQGSPCWCTRANCCPHSCEGAPIPSTNLSSLLMSVWILPCSALALQMPVPL